MISARATRSSAFILTLVLSLVTSVALAQKPFPADKYAPTELAGITPTSDVIKFLRDCPAGTDAYFKNVNPFISGGPGGEPGELQFYGTFLVDGSEVGLTVAWKDDNSFRFQVSGGIAYAVGAEVDSDKLIYTYPVPVFEDRGLNVLKEDGTDSADVNHLDLCLSLVDSTPPVIEFIKPLAGDTVSGTVTVEVRVTDGSGIESVSASVYPTGDPAFATPLDFVSRDGDVYTWTWNALEPVEFASGSYTIAVTATDQAVPATNTATVDVSVELVNSLTNCFGILGSEDFPNGAGNDPYANGCQPTPLVNVQAPPYTTVCNPDLLANGAEIPDICFLAGKQLKADPTKFAGAAATYGGCDACGDLTNPANNYCGDFGIPDPRMKCTQFDVNGNCTGEWVPKTLQPLYVTDVVVGTTELVLGKYVYGYKGCFAASQHVRGGASIVDLYPVWPEEPPTGGVFVKTHTPAAVVPPGLVVACNYGELDASQAGYQPVGKTLSVDTLEDLTTPAITLVATEECRNPARTLTRDNGIDVSNIIETDGSGDPVAFKYQMAQLQFDALFAALECAEPTFLRGKVKFSDVSSPVNQAKAQFDNGTIAALERARDDLDDAALAIRTGKWDMTAENCAGDALARTENLAWRMTDLLAAMGVPVVLD